MTDLLLPAVVNGFLPTPIAEFALMTALVLSSIVPAYFLFRLFRWARERRLQRRVTEICAEITQLHFNITAHFDGSIHDFTATLATSVRDGTVSSLLRKNPAISAKEAELVLARLHDLADRIEYDQNLRQ